jgi:hypothetical protein
MLIRKFLLIAVLVVAGTFSWESFAENGVPRKTQTEILAETLAALNLSNPIADLEANIAKGDMHFIGINGYSCNAPGVVSDEDELLVMSAKYGLRCLAGTSDVLESNKQKVLIDRALEYARTYNVELLRRVHAGRI